MFVLNSPFMVEQARELAQRLQTASEIDAERVDLAYRLLYARSPSDEESRLGITFLGSDAALERWQQYVHVLLAANELLYID
jgi:hypothetical protein